MSAAGTHCVEGEGLHLSMSVAGTHCDLSMSVAGTYCVEGEGLHSSMSVAGTHCVEGEGLHLSMSAAGTCWYTVWRGRVEGWLAHSQNQKEVRAQNADMADKQTPENKGTHMLSARRTC